MPGMSLAVGRALMAFAILLFAETATADMPSMVKRVQKKDYVFGSIKITQSFDSRKDPMDPDFKLQLWDKGRLLLSLNDVAFDNIYPSPDHELFVGLSNSGWPGSAVIVFNRRGRVWFVAHHGTSEFDYCAASPTMLKEWYDDKDPALQFSGATFSADDLLHISLRNCKGETVDLWETVARATEKANALRKQAGR